MPFVSMMRSICCVDRLHHVFAIDPLFAVYFNVNIRHGMFFAMAGFAWKGNG
jgi:hypothetical protein